MYEVSKEGKSISEFVTKVADNAIKLAELFEDYRGRVAHERRDKPLDVEKLIMLYDMSVLNGHYRYRFYEAKDCEKYMRKLKKALKNKTEIGELDFDILWTMFGDDYLHFEDVIYNYMHSQLKAIFCRKKFEAFITPVFKELDVSWTMVYEVSINYKDENGHRQAYKRNFELHYSAGF